MAHRAGNAADGTQRERAYPSDLNRRQWRVVRKLIPVPAWLGGRGGRPEGYCHRVMIDAILYLVSNGIKWRAMPADFPPFLWNQICQESPGLSWRTSTMGSRVAVGGTLI
jgi:transposase